MIFHRSPFLVTRYPVYAETTGAFSGMIDHTYISLQKIRFLYAIQTASSEERAS